jgi:putative DNA primase/helicase
MSAFARIRAALGDRVTREHDDSLSARCPAHDDANASLSVSREAGKALLCCHVGCTAQAIAAALGLTVADLFDATEDKVPFGVRPEVGQRLVIKSSNIEGVVTALYDYHDAAGQLLYTKVRLQPKQFLMGCARETGQYAGQWVLGTDKRSTVLYRLPQVAAAIAAAAPVFFPEGEKDADALVAMGFVATCNRDGAATGRARKWTSRESNQLAGLADAIILPDNDAAGEAHAAAVATSLRTLSPAPRVRVLRLPGLPPKGDVSDWIAAGGTAEQLRALVENLTDDTSTAVAPAASADEESALGPDITEDGLALTFTSRHGTRLRFCSTLGGWQVYDGVRWHRDETRLPYSHARTLVRELAQGTQLSPKQYTKLRSGTTINAIVSLASSDRQHAIVQHAFDADPWLLNTPGGVIDLRTGTLRAGQAEDYCTKATGVTPGGEAPRWRQFLAEVTGQDAVLAAYLQRLAGYWLTGATTEHALVFFYGTGGNGKSVFLNVLLYLLGTYGMQAPMSLFEEKTHDGHPTELAMLRGARLVVATETEEGRRWAESRIKVMTGGDPITARFMRGDFFTYLPQFKPVIAGNHRPRFRNPDEAIRRRLHLVPFAQRFENPDRDLGAKLQAEGAGILQWCVDGCLSWQQQGLQPPDRVRIATDDYLEAEDSVGAWLAECCDLEPGAWTASAVLWESWERWAQARGEFVGSQRRLAERLVARGFTSERDANRTRRGFRGIRLGTLDSPSDEATGRFGHHFPISTSHARAHDAPARARAQAERSYGETASEASGGSHRCIVCDNPSKVFWQPGTVCFECRKVQEPAA